jgi:hypothetical protein
MRFVVALIFSLFYGLFLCGQASAEAPEMSLMIKYLKNDPGTRFDGKTFELVFTNPAKGDQFTIRYTPGDEQTEEALTLHTMISFALTDDAPPAVCESMLIDRGVLGVIGPRDGWTRCIGQLNLARSIASLRVIEYDLHVTFLKAIAMATDAALEGGGGATPRPSTTPTGKATRNGA